jgi:hypothetical protein
VNGLRHAQMKQNTICQITQAARDKQMEAEFERYMAHAIGHKPAGRMYATTLHSR